VCISGWGRERRRVDDGVVDEQDVQVDDARRPAVAGDARASHRPLDREQRLEQRCGASAVSTWTTAFTNQVGASPSGSVS
jgi:hypothetical protein